MSDSNAQRLFILTVLVVVIVALFLFVTMIFDHQKVTRELHEETVQTCVQEGGVWIAQSPDGGMCLIGLEKK